MKLARPSLLLALGLMLLSLSAWGQRGYEVVNPAVPTSTGNQIEVLEFFWYGCPHCYALHPHIDSWLKSKPDNVEFKFVAAPLNPSWTMHSRAYYAADAMDVVDEFHGPFFDAIHKGRQPMRSEDEIVAFAASLGIDGVTFRQSMYSFTAETNMRRAMQLAEAYRLTGVPTLTVNGKYKTTATLAGGHPQMIKVINTLIRQESGS